MEMRIFVLKKWIEPLFISYYHVTSYLDLNSEENADIIYDKPYFLLFSNKHIIRFNC